MQSSSPFEIILRIGFDNPTFSNSPDQFFFSGRNNQNKYRLDSSFKELIPLILNGDTPFIIFVDEVVKLTDSGLQAIEDFLEANINIAGLTLSSDALETIYSLQKKKGLFNRLTDNIRTTRIMPSWFSIINREYLIKSGLLNCGYQTLEFFLCELSENLARNSNNIIILDSIILDFDYSAWIRDIILLNSARLASDYLLSKRRNERESIDIKVPGQFKIEMSGEFIPNHADEHSGYNTHNTPDISFSVICPAFKSTFFEETVNSVLGQSWENWEFVVLIDGPPEAEKARLISILEKHNSDHRIRFSTQENKGTGPTRRLLAQMAKGDFIITIDDDDMFSPDVLKIFADTVRQYPDTAVLRGGAQLFGLVDLYLPPRQRTMVNGIAGDLFEATQPFAIKRNALEYLGGFEGDKSFGEAGEDSDLFLKIDKAGLKTCLLDRPMYLRRISTFNQTLSFKPEECMDHIRSLINRHTPPDWIFENINFQKDGPFIKAAVSYKCIASGQEVTVPTRFFDYQTLGENSDVLIDLEITSMCNSVCSFCPRDSVKRNNKFISMDLVNVLADQISLETGKRQVILCGIGESTLHPELETIVSTLNRAGAKVCMTTNGSRMDVDKFRALAESGITEINFSINAATAETHQKVMKMKNFDQIRENLSEVLICGKTHYPHVELNVSFVFCNVNHHEVFDFVKQWRNTGVSRIWIHPVNSRGGLVSEDIRNVDILPVEKRFTGDDLVIVDVFQHVPEQGNVCKIAHSLDFISVDGDMLLCALDYRCSSVIGNLRDTTLQKMHLNKYLKYKRGEINRICHDCYFLPKRRIQA